MPGDRPSASAGSHIVAAVVVDEQPEAIHLKPAAPLAERVLLPGDPHRALAVAEALLEGARMFNHHRGLWGYTGAAPDGRPLTVQSTGMGGPSAAIVVEELVALGARTLVRVGTCGALDPGLGLGDLLAASEVIPHDGTSVALGARGPLRPAPGLGAALAEAAGAAGPVVSTDLFYDPRPGLASSWRAEGAVAVEMEAAAILRVAELHEAAAGCLLVVSDLIGEETGAGIDARVRRADSDRGPPPRARLDREAIERVGPRLGQVAFAALVEASRRASS